MDRVRALSVCRGRHLFFFVFIAGGLYAVTTLRKDVWSGLKAEIFHEYGGNI